MSGNAKHSSLLRKSVKLTVFMTSDPGPKFILVGFKKVLKDIYRFTHLHLYANTYKHIYLHTCTCMLCLY